MLRPILSVADVDEASDYFCDTLAFTQLFALQDKNETTFLASLRFAEAELMLSRQQTLDMPEDLRRQARGDMTIMLSLPDTLGIDDYYAQVAAKGVSIRDEIADKFWGNREFTLVDPNGYCLTFSAPNKRVSLEAAQQASRSLDLDAPAPSSAGPEATTASARA